MRIGNTALVTTINEKWRMCYACVRGCPAKAIRVVDGQASVVAERCIGCGSCIGLCAQHAKKVYSSIEGVEELLRSGRRVAAILAPSFPAEFTEYSPEQLSGVLRFLGFSSVHEVAFGADLVAREYRRIMKSTTDRFIGTTCPAAVRFVENYYSDMVDRLIPVVSPMVAMGRVVKKKYGTDTAVVFIGPCIAKKGEAFFDEVFGSVDAVLTYAETRRMIEKNGYIADADPVPLDGPLGGLGALFPISRGILQAAELPENLLNGDIVVAEGKNNFWETIRQFRRDPGEVRFLEVLSCHGCIMGAGFSRDEPILVRRGRVSQYVRKKMATLDRGLLQRELDEYSSVPLHRAFSSMDQRLDRPSDEELQRILGLMGIKNREDELNCGACGYNTCRKQAVAIHRGLAEPEMCLPHTVESLKKTIQELEESHKDLTTVREALIQSEKLASMGQLAAGIAHEVNNPLGIVLMYAHLLLEKCESSESMKEMGEDLTTIVDHANRCKKIVAGLLNFARQNKVFRQPTDLAALVANALKAVVIPENVGVVVENQMLDAIAEVDPDQMSQVLINLFSNACAAMPNGGVLSVKISGDDEIVSFEVEDTGTGISKENMKKIFEPFFSTKQVGKGTGLGLAVAHGIVKMHMGQISVRSNADPAAGHTGTVFTVTVPRREPRYDG